MEEEFNELRRTSSNRSNARNNVTQKYTEEPLSYSYHETNSDRIGKFDTSLEPNKEPTKELLKSQSDGNTNTKLGKTNA